MKKIIILILLGVLFLGITSSVFAQDKYSPREKDYLLNLARETLVWYLKYNKMPDIKAEQLTKNLRENRPCFVTLEKNGRLRGCIGLFEFEKPLYKNVIDRSMAAATQDNRFDPVAYNELKDIVIEISILTEPKELKFNSAEDLFNKLHPFEDGVILYTKYGSSTYLPQVWEQLSDKKDFLSNLCEKHGAPADYWKTNSKELKVEIYHVVAFKEKYSGKIIIGPYGAIAGRRGAKVIGAVSLLKEGLDFGNIFAKEGTELAPGAIVTEDSDIIEK